MCCLFIKILTLRSVVENYVFRNWYKYIDKEKELKRTFTSASNAVDCGQKKIIPRISSMECKKMLVSRVARLFYFFSTFFFWCPSKFERMAYFRFFIFQCDDSLPIFFSITIHCGPMNKKFVWGKCFFLLHSTWLFVSGKKGTISSRLPHERVLIVLSN